MFGTDMFISTSIKNHQVCPEETDEEFNASV